VKVDADVKISRRALSREVCRWLYWRSPKGKLQDMACRVALGESALKGALRLPSASRVHAFERSRGRLVRVLRRFRRGQGALDFS